MTGLASSVGGDPAARTTAAPATGQPHGRTVITARALDRVVRAVSGAALGVEPRRVGADVRDASGLLALDVRAPIRLPSLIDVAADGEVVQRGGGSILQRAESARAEIRSRVEAITGSSIARVVVRVEAAHIEPERRVR